MASPSPQSQNLNQQIITILSIEFGSLNQTQLSTWDLFISIHKNKLKKVISQDNLDSPQKLFEFFRKNPQSLYEIIFNNKNPDQATVNGALLKNLVDEMHQDKAEIAAILKSHLPNISDQQLNQTIQILLQLQAIKFQEQIKSEQQAVIEKELNTSYPKAKIDPTADPLYKTKTLVNKAITQLTQNYPDFSNLAKEQAKQYLLTAIVAKTFNPTVVSKLTTAAETSLILSNPNYHPQTQIATLIHHLKSATQTATPKNIIQSITNTHFTENPPLPAPNTSTPTASTPTTQPITPTPTTAQTQPIYIIFAATKTAISPEEIKTSLASIDPTRLTQEFIVLEQTIAQNLDLADSAQTAIQEIERITNTADSPQIKTIAKQFIPPPFDFHKLIILKPEIFHPLPSSEASQTAEILKPVNPALAQNLLFYSQFYSPDPGQTPLQQFHALAIQYIQNRQDNNQPLNAIEALEIQATYNNLAQIQTSPLAQEVSYSHPPSHIYQTFIRSPLGNLINRLPNGPRNIANFIIAPRQSIVNFFTRKTGKKIAAQIYKKFTKHVTNKFARHVAKTFLKEGSKKAIQFLLKEAAKKTLQAVAQLANIAPGLGVVLGFLIEIGDKLIKYVIKPLIGAALAVIVSIWGSKPKPEEIIGGIALAANMGSSAAQMALTAITAAIAATRAAAAATATTIIGASAIAIFLYLTAFTIAPIIAALAQLGPAAPYSNLGPITSGRPAVIPPSQDITSDNNCPVSSPLNNPPQIAQGSHQGTHTLNYNININNQNFTSEGEAVDYLLPPGTKVSSTHSGTAFFFYDNTASRQGLGKHVIVVSQCQNHSFISIYAHLQDLSHPAGSSITLSKGNLIGTSGQSGTLGDSPHLHYELIGLGDIYRYL